MKYTIIVLGILFVSQLIDNIRLYRAINEIGKNLHEAKDILGELQKKYEDNIDLATKLGYERAMKDAAEKQAYARSWEEESKNAR